MAVARRALFAGVLLVCACGGGESSLGPDAGVDAGVDAMPGPPPPPAGQNLFDPDVLHTVELTVAAADLPKLDDDANPERVPATLVFDGQTITNVGLRKKGTSSRRPLAEKTGFTVKLNTFVPGQKLDGLKKFEIDNAIQDPSFLTGHLAYEVYRRAGLPAPRTAHATLRFNGVDKGIFVLEEATNSDYLKQHFGAGTGNLYEGPWDFHKGVADADLKDEVEDMRSRADLTALTNVVMNTPNEQLVAQLAPLIDLDQFIKNYAVEMVASLWDNYAIVAWNYYFYHVPNGKFVILTNGVNWPCCNISGAPNWKSDLDPYDIYADPWQAGSGYPPGRLCDKVNNIPALKTQFDAQLRQVARESFDVAALLARADRAAATLRSRPLTGRSATDLASFNAQLENVKKYVRDRKAYLTNRLNL